MARILLFFFSVLAALLSTTSLVIAQNSTSTNATSTALASPIPTGPAASTFIVSAAANFTFSLNIANDSDDIFFRMEGPIGQSWLAVGFGDRMAGSLIFVAYASSDAGNVTLSPRLGTGHNEPTFSPSTSVTLLPGSGIFNYTYTILARCTNCRTWGPASSTRKHSLDLTSTAYPLIFAFGPDVSLASASPAADLARHDSFGHFTLNLQTATGPGGVPEPATHMFGASSVGSAQADFDYAKLAHGLCMCFAFVFLFPLGALYARVFGWMRMHLFNQVLGSLLVISGFGVAVSVAGRYNKSKAFNTPHQIIGLIILGALLIQIALGFHNRAFRATQTHPLKTQIHAHLGHVLLVLGAVNGGLGLAFAGVPGRLQVIYALAVVAMALFYLMLYWFKARWNRHKEIFKSPAGSEGEEVHYLEDMQSEGPVRGLPARQGVPPVAPGGVPGYPQGARGWQ